MKSALLPLTVAAVAISTAWAGEDTKLPRTFALDIAAGKIHEECIALKKGSVVPYRFQASQPLPFNIHYHVGKGKDEKIEYPVKIDGVDKKEGRLTVPLDQHYCWMWSNKTAAPVRVSGRIGE